jgi:glutathione synthase/RimK-type ligase-like ATP-grasp enzyme
VVGLALSAKKSDMWKDILSGSTEVDWILLPETNPLSSIDLILSKVSDFHSPSNPVLDVLDCYDSVPCITSVGTQRVVSDRLEMMNRMDNELCVKTPETVLWDATSIELYDQPKMIKPRVACGPKWSHSMAIVNSSDDVVDFVSRFPPVEFVLQEFIPNEGWILKLFVIGERCFCFRRDTVSGAGSAIPVSPTLSLLAHELKNIFQFDLFGADLIEHNTTKELFVIDVNYFPTYAELGEQRRWLMEEYVLHKWQTLNSGS